MPLSKVQKVALLAQLEERLARMKALIFLNYQGLKVKESEALRRKLHAAGGDFQITKNTLLRLALKKAGLSYDEEILDQPLAIAIGYDDTIAPSKTVYEFGKVAEALNILGGIMEGQFVSAEQVKALALLPSREELYAKVVGSLAAPLGRLVRVLKGNLYGLVSVLKQYEQKLS